MQRTLEEVGKGLGVTRERIRQIEAKAFRRLKHPSRQHLFAQWQRAGSALHNVGDGDGTSGDGSPDPIPLKPGTWQADGRPADELGESADHRMQQIFGLIRRRSRGHLRDLAVAFAEMARGRPGTEVWAQRSRYTPSYFQIRCEGLRQVAAYVHPRAHDVLIDFRLPADHSTYGIAEARPGHGAYGIRLSVKDEQGLSAATSLLNDVIVTSRP